MCKFYFSEPGDGQTCLHLSACYNDEAIIKILVSLGADCNVSDKQGRTPFMRAAEFGHIQALNLLLDSCDNPDLSGKGLSCLHLCFYMFFCFFFVFFLFF